MKWKILLVGVSLSFFLCDLTSAGSAKIPPAGPKSSIQKSGKIQPRTTFPFWEGEWRAIREEVLRRYWTGCLQKFQDRSVCKRLDPIKADIPLKVGRAVNSGNIEEATRWIYEWARFQPYISRNTARIYDFALSTLALAVIQRGEENPKTGNRFLKLFSRLSSQKRIPTLDQIEGLKAVLNLGIMNCDLLLSSQVCIFQKIVKRYPHYFLAAARAYPNETLGLACVDYANNTFNRYTRVDREQSGTSAKQRISIAATIGYVSTYIDPSLQGPLWGCHSCEMIENDFSCLKGLPPCLQNQDSGVTSREVRMLQIPMLKQDKGSKTIQTETKSVPPGESKRSMPGGFMSDMQTGNLLTDWLGQIPEDLESMRAKCDPSSVALQMASAAGGTSKSGQVISRAAMSCLLVANSIGTTGEIMQCALLGTSDTRMPRDPNVLFQRAFQSPWLTIADRECLRGVGLSENQGGGELIPSDWLARVLDERDMTSEERARFQEGLDEAMRALHSDAIAQEIVGACTLHGTSTCEDYHERIDQMADTLLNGGEAGISNFEHTGSPNALASTPAALPNGGGSRYSIVFSDAALNNPVTIAHEIAHWYLTENGVPSEPFESTLGSPDLGSLQHDVTNTIACIMDSNQCGQGSGGSRTRSTEPEKTPEREPPDPPDPKKIKNEYCAPDQEDCGCSAMSQAFGAMVECERSRMEEKFEENAPPPPGSDPIGPVTYSETDSNEPIMSKRVAAAMECNRFFLSRAEPTQPARVSSTTLDYCDDPEVDPCRCYGCGGGGLAPSYRCGDVECEEGYHCGPLSGRCERDMDLGDDSPIPSAPEGD